MVPDGRTKLPSCGPGTGAGALPTGAGAVAACAMTTWGAVRRDAASRSQSIEVLPCSFDGFSFTVSPLTKCMPGEGGPPLLDTIRLFRMHIAAHRRAARYRSARRIKGAICRLSREGWLPTQGQAFAAATLNVWFREKPPFRLQDRASTSLMTGSGWIAAANPSRREIQLRNCKASPERQSTLQRLPKQLRQTHSIQLRISVPLVDP